MLVKMIQPVLTVSKILLKCQHIVSKIYDWKVRLFSSVLERESYIDRTNLIIDLLNNKEVMNSASLITSPLRFGKTMNMKMLKGILSIEFNRDQKFLKSTKTKIGQLIRLKVQKILRF